MVKPRKLFTPLLAPKPSGVDRTTDPIKNHPDGCECPRCAGLEECYRCKHIKLDIDWCWHCGRLVL